LEFWLVREHGRNLQDGIRDALVQFYVAHDPFFHVYVEDDDLGKVRDEMLAAVNVNFRDKSLPRGRRRERLRGDVGAENVDGDDGCVVLGAVGGGGGGDVDDVGDVNVDSVHTRVVVDVGHDGTVLPVDVGETGHKKAVGSRDPDIPDDDESESDAREANPKCLSTAAPQMPFPQLEVGGSEVVPKLDSN
jgi:hypothetical protein